MYWLMLRVQILCNGGMKDSHYALTVPNLFYLFILHSLFILLPTSLSFTYNLQTLHINCSQIFKKCSCIHHLHSFLYSLLFLINYFYVYSICSQNIKSFSALFNTVESFKFKRGVSFHGLWVFLLNFMIMSAFCFSKKDNSSI